VAHACDPSYSEGRDQEDRSLRPAEANSLWDSVLKTPNTKMAGRVAQVVECLPGKHEASLSWTPGRPPPPKKKRVSSLALQPEDKMGEIVVHEKGWTKLCIY
jgi:hypothetical protein